MRPSKIENDDDAFEEVPESHGYEEDSFEDRGPSDSQSCAQGESAYSDDPAWQTNFDQISLGAPTSHRDAESPRNHSLERHRDSELGNLWSKERAARLKGAFPERAVLESHNPAAAVEHITDRTSAAASALQARASGGGPSPRLDWIRDRGRSEWGVGEQGDWLDARGPHRGPPGAPYRVEFSGGGFTEVLVDGLEWPTAAHHLLRAFRAVGAVAAARVVHHEVRSAPRRAAAPA